MTRLRARRKQPARVPGRVHLVEAIRRWVHHQSNESVGFIAEVLQALIRVVIVDKGTGFFSSMTASVG